MNDLSPYAWIGATVVTLAIVATLALLAWHGTITGEAFVAIVGPLIGAGGGAASAHAGFKSGAKASRRRDEGGY